MHYLRFVISNYRAIVGPLTVDVSRPRLIPIIGVNESGKTTVLQALFAFDYCNDDLNDDGRHLRDVVNLYSTSPGVPTVTADIDISRDELHVALTACEKDHPTLRAGLAAVRSRRKIPRTIRITRNLTTKRYSIDSGEFGSPDQQEAIAVAVIGRLPYTLFFDDFRDKIEDKVEIVASQAGTPFGWLAILDQLFKSTDKSFSVFSLPTLEERQRKTVLAKVQRHLNETLTKQWQAFRLDDREALQLSVDIVTERAPLSAPKHYIKLDVVEVDSAGDKHFFYISDRSKGFFWFFNFVMKLEFNPKVVSASGMTIYLLDEPGSYLHAFAQRKLCTKLRQLAEKCCVLYCTHSHYLLDPETIPVNSIQLAEKDDDGSVVLTRISDYRSGSTERRSALQPVIDALQIRPFALDVIGTRTTLITEGIYDYFAIELFRGRRSVAILPATSADSVRFFVSLMIAWQIDFRALWDNDKEGRAKHAEACERFGSEIANRHFRLLPTEQAHGNRIIQSLFDGADLVYIRDQLGLASDSSFERTMHAAFYAPQRAALLTGVSAKTHQNFERLFESLELP